MSFGHFTMGLKSQATTSQGQKRSGSTWTGGSRPSQGAQSSQGSVRPQTGSFKGPKSECAKCGKNHYGECRLGTDSCFKCGQPGLFAKECPQIVSGSGSRVGQTRKRQFSAGRGQG